MLKKTNPASAGFVRSCLYQRMREGGVRHLAAMSGDVPCNPAVYFGPVRGRATSLRPTGFTRFRFMRSSPNEALAYKHSRFPRWCSLIGEKFRR